MPRLTAWAPLFIFWQPLLSATEPMGSLEAWGRGRRKVFSGPCELLAGLQAKMFVQSDSLCAWKKKKKSWFQIHFRIYNLWCLPVEFFAHLKLPSFNHLPLSTQEPLVDWPARLPCKAKATWEQLAFIAFLINSFYFQLSSDSLHTHTLWRLISPWPWHMPLFFLFHCLKCMWKH